MKKVLFLFLFILFLSSSFALDCSELNPMDIGISNIDYSSYGTFNFVITEYSVFREFNADLKVIPQLQIVGVSTDGEIIDDEYNNSILNIYYGEISSSSINWEFSNKMYVNYDNPMPSINPQFPYPVNSFPDEVLDYLEFTDYANTNELVSNKANDLVNGVSDYFTALSNIAEFVAYYIEYDDSFSSTDFSATQVFSSQVGVCKEYSSLLISMLRNVNIPARYVSGYSFSNKGEATCSSFIGHSWVEAYVPSYGWMQIDPTFKEFFKLDAGHVPLYKAPDLDESIVQVSVMNNSQFSINSPNTDIEFISYYPPTQRVSMSLEIYPEEVRANDYFILNVAINNPLSTWFLDNIYLVSGESFNVYYTHEYSSIIVPPKSMIHKYYIIKTPTTIGCNPENCSGVTYFSPVIVNLGSGNSESFDITIVNGDALNTYSSLEELIPEQELELSTNLMIFNKEINPERVIDEEPVLGLDYQNIGNVKLDGLKIRLDYSNVSIVEDLGSLNIGDSEHYSRILEFSGVRGMTPVNITIYNNQFSISSSDSYVIVQEPTYSFNIQGLAEINQDVDYEVFLDYSIIPSDFVGSTIQVLVNNESIMNQAYNYDYVRFNISSTNLEYGTNDIEVIMNYFDSIGNEYLTSDSLIMDYKPKLSIIEWIQLIANAISEFFKLLFQG